MKNIKKLRKKRSKRKGRYEKGKIIVPQFPDVKEKTRVIIAFMEKASQKEESNSLTAKEIPLSLPRRLEDIDVSVSTANRYKAQLAKVTKEKTVRKSLHSPFFTSPPLDLGYTDSSMLDKIIAGEKVDANIC